MIPNFLNAKVGLNDTSAKVPLTKLIVVANKQKNLTASRIQLVFYLAKA